MATAQHSQEHLLAALALSDLANRSAQEVIVTDEDMSPSSGPDAESALDAETPACALSELPGTTDHWPCAPGKGWFAKSRRGTEVHFLERIFLMLSYGHLRLRTDPSRTLRDTIRWLSPPTAAKLGVPPGVWAFEIVCVELFEREVYPQYASGSFNKTAAKWCLISPPSAGAAAAAAAAAASADGAPGASAAAPVRKLCRQCIYLPRSWVVDGAEHPVDAHGAFRPLEDGLSEAQVNEYAARHVRALQEHTVRQVYRLREESERRRKLGLAHASSQPASQARAREPAIPRTAGHVTGAGSASSEEVEPELCQLGCPPGQLERRIDEWRKACAAEGARGSVPPRHEDACQPGELTPPSGPIAGAHTEPDKHTFLTPNPNNSPLAGRIELAGGALHVGAPAALAPSVESLARAHLDDGFGAPLSRSADPDGGYHSRTASDGPGSDETHARTAAAVVAAESDEAGGGERRSWAPPVWATGASGAHPPFARSVSTSDVPLHERGLAPGAYRSAQGVRDGAHAVVPARPQRQASDRSIGTSAAAAVAQLSIGSGVGGGARLGSPQRALSRPVAPQRAFSEGGALADGGGASAASHVFPYAPGKGWFAFNRSGKSIYFLDRLFRMLSSPQLPLRKHPRAVLGDVIRWMAPAQALANGVPAGIAAFEIINTELFEDEVYPQFKSGSFRKTAKHWCILSPQPNTAVQQKLSVKCMFIPADRLSDAGVHEPVDCYTCFRPLEAHATEAEIEQYIQDHIRPLEERVRGSLLSAAASSRERERASTTRDFLPPEKRHKGGAAVGRRPPLHHQRSSHL